MQPRRWMSKLYPESVWYKPQLKPGLFLTFDDGPVPEVTPWVLNTLNAFNAQATFFCVGKNVAQHPQLYSDIKRFGHSVGNHTMHHLKGFKTPWKHYVKDVLQARQHIHSNLFRPPYGQLTRYQAKALKQLGFTLVFWDVITYDYNAQYSAAACLKAALENVRPGSIVLFHDSVKAFPRLQYALPELLEYCKIRCIPLHKL